LRRRDGPRQILCSQISEALAHKFSIQQPGGNQTLSKAAASLLDGQTSWRASKAGRFHAVDFRSFKVEKISR